jgi:glutaredoxin
MQLSFNFMESGVKKFVIYGRPDCPWCDKAKNLLADGAYSFVYKNVRESPQIREELLDKVPFAKSVPQIFSTMPSMGEIYVGGYTELVEFLQN